MDGDFIAAHCPKMTCPALWEQLNNPGFSSIEFDGIKKQAGLNSHGNMALLQSDGLNKRFNQIAIRRMQTLATSAALRQIEPPKRSEA